MKQTKLSVTIITFNEERNIEHCIKSLSFADEIIVVDSYSTDRTAILAKNLGATVIQNHFVGYGQQKNFAASKCSGDWIFNVDADESPSKELQKSIFKAIHDPQALDAYKVPRLTNYCGRWIYYGGWYPGYITRLCRKNTADWTMPFVHEDLKLNRPGQYGYLKGDLLHYSFPTVKSQVQTNVNFAELASKDLLRRKGRPPYLWEVIIRPLFKFFECYILKKGLFDRAPGLIIAANAAHSMFMKYSIAYLETKSIQVGDSTIEPIKRDLND